MGFHDAIGRYHEWRAQMPLSLHDFREVAAAGGAVANIAGNGGILASDTTPVMGAEATTESHVIIWAATNQDPIGFQRALPENFDGRNDVLVDLWVRTDNAGGGGIEAATFDVVTSWDNGAQVTDTAVDASPSEAIHKITARVAAADVPDRPGFLNLQIIPGTHANDPVRLLAVRITYVQRPQSD
jgi:hypothetical protein